MWLLKLVTFCLVFYFLIEQCISQEIITYEYTSLKHDLSENVNVSLIETDFLEYIDDHQSDSISEKDVKIPIEEVKNDMPAIRMALRYFESVSSAKRHVDCSDYVPLALRHLVELFDNSNRTNASEPTNSSSAEYSASSAAAPVDSRDSSPAASLHSIHSTDYLLTDWSRVPVMSPSTRQLLRKPLYAKILRPAVHECMRAATRMHDIHHPPLENPFAPVRLGVTFGANKLVDLSFEGTLVMFAQLTLKWNDSNWRWSTNTRYAARGSGHKCQSDKCQK